LTRSLLLLAGLACLGAVLNHTVGWGYTSLFWWTDRYMAAAVPDFSQLGGASYYGLRVVEQAVSPSVPSFLFVSGYFVAFAAGRSGVLPWPKIAARLRMLVIPYVIWSVAIFAARVLEGTVDTPEGYATKLLFGRAAIPYYYIPLLTQLYLLAPLIVRGVRSNWRAWLAGAIVLQLLVQAARYPVILGWHAPAARWIWQHAPGWFFPQMVIWFVLGAAVAANATAVRQRLAHWRPLLPWLTLALLAAGVAEWEWLLRLSGKPWLNPSPTVVDTLYSGAFVFTFLAFAASASPKSGWLDLLGERSFGIYLVHEPVLEIVARACYHAAPFVVAHQAVMQPLLLAVGLGVPLLLMEAIRRSPARVSYNYLFG
jgi:surface polysaccharide O-acyltransferase-like enzyme